MQRDPRIVSQFLDAACLRYDGHDCPETRQIAKQLLQEHPDLPAVDINTAACLALPQTVRAMLAKQPNAVHQTSGPRDWPPLLYLTYSRLNIHNETFSSDPRETLEILLQAGADPNSAYTSEHHCIFTAVTGALGNGEGGLLKQPPHPHGFELAERLLSAGAEPNDSQALYNWMQTHDDERCLELCLRHGLRAEHTLNWEPDRDIHTLDYLLTYAVSNGLTERCRFLLQHGADASVCREDGITLYRIAVRYGYDAVATLLSAAGATLDITLCDRFFGACFRGDTDYIKECHQENPGLINDLSANDRTILHQVAAKGSPEVVTALLEIGFNVNEREPSGYQHTPLHKAAMHGRHDIVELLLQRGADRTALDTTYQGTPREWAKHHGHELLAAFIAAWPHP
ncbi:ankyrin repeat domain-containing protein [Acanthopleuribacter pedis]|uniref:Ankyrin repeat domain-containing protein n=1 Tax=Acanthopleuribacter pedis TaxID=442870 RepID=A0A8J7Q8B3_9BACT|nr:ankyrin repeat domain-containing protein [Acanthopleuribacter pedis]MBO1319269.1 ankyrin repeat domain-containing protein [Acanthopleuribacter pedis]